VGAAVFYSAFTSNDFIFMLQGAGKTLLLTAWSGILGTLLGAIVGWIRTFRIPIVNQVFGAYIDIVRSVPLVIQLIVINSGASILGASMTPFQTGAFTLTLYMSAFTSEVVTAGIQAVPRPLRRAARGLGMSPLQEIRYIVAPLGIRIIFPAWIGLVLGLLKDSSLVAVVGYIELLRASQIIINRMGQPLEVLLGAGVFYFVMSYALSWYGAYQEKRWHA
jgi:His/Glu/Gln/Arg/opine family amino acid ABC transporter permease subunit